MNLFLLKTAYAASEADALISKINQTIINPFIGLMIGVAVIFFLYGVVEFIAGADNEEKRSQGKAHMIWGIIGLFIMVAVFGIINVIIKTLDTI